MPDSSGQQAVTSFQQQGQVDWIALSNSTFTFTLGVISRLNKAGVDTLTSSIGKILCKRLALTLNGQERVQSAISKLKGWPSYRKVVWFGFGERHLVHELALTEEGVTLVALSSAIQGTYGEMFAARVFRHLTAELKAPDDLSPSIHQWLSLMTACAGTLCTGDFPKLLESFRRYLSPRSANGYKVTDPEAIAKAILSLGHVAEKRQDTHNFIGGIDCSWIAAVAEWLYDLCVEIRDPGGTIIYRSSFTKGMRKATPQVRIIKSTLQDDPISIISRSALLPSTVNIIHHGGKYSREYIQRAEWNAILRESFGEYSLNMLLTGEIGRASSRLFRVILVESLVNHSDLSWGPIKANGCTPFTSFIARVIKVSKIRFPELRGWLEMAEDPISVEDEKGWSDNIYQNTINNGCHCLQDRDFVCLKLIFAAIVELSRSFQDMEMQPNLLPTVSGVRELCSETLFLEECSSSPKDDYTNSGDIEQRLEQFNPFKLICGEEPFRKRLKIVQRAFTGVAKSRYFTESYAMSGEGICAFYRALLDPDLSPENTYQIMVLPGVIEYKLTHYSEVTGVGCLSSFGYCPRTSPILDRVAIVDPMVDESEERDILCMGFLARYHSEDYLQYSLVNVFYHVYRSDKLKCTHQSPELKEGSQLEETFTGVKNASGETIRYTLSTLFQSDDNAKGPSHGEQLPKSRVFKDFFAKADFSNGCWLISHHHVSERSDPLAVEVSFRGLSPNIETDRCSLDKPFASSNGMPNLSTQRYLLLKPLCPICILHLVGCIIAPSVGEGSVNSLRIDFLLMGPCAVKDFTLRFDLRLDDVIKDELEGKKRDDIVQGE